VGASAPGAAGRSAGQRSITFFVANVNLDGGNELFGRTRDVAPLGIELSTPGQTVADAAWRSGFTVTPDPAPAEGYFLRADKQFAEFQRPANPRPGAACATQ
jgi:hypothetical protein